MSSACAEAAASAAFVTPSAQARNRLHSAACTLRGSRRAPELKGAEQLRTAWRWQGQQGQCAATGRRRRADTELHLGIPARSSTLCSEGDLGDNIAERGHRHSRRRDELVACSICTAHSEHLFQRLQEDHALNYGSACSQIDALSPFAFLAFNSGKESEVVTPS